LARKTRKFTQNGKAIARLNYLKGEADATREANKIIRALEDKIALMRSDKWHELCQDCPKATPRIRKRLNLLTRKNERLRSTNHHLWLILTEADNLAGCGNRIFERHQIVTMLQNIRVMLAKRTKGKKKRKK
jgi:hypothetical protein